MKNAMSYVYFAVVSVILGMVFCIVLIQDNKNNKEKILNMPQDKSLYQLNQSQKSQDQINDELNKAVAEFENSEKQLFQEERRRVLDLINNYERNYPDYRYDFFQMREKTFASQTKEDLYEILFKLYGKFGY